MHNNGTVNVLIFYKVTDIWKAIISLLIHLSTFAQGIQLENYRNNNHHNILNLWYKYKYTYIEYYCLPSYAMRKYVNQLMFEKVTQLLHEFSMLINLFPFAPSHNIGLYDLIILVYMIL